MAWCDKPQIWSHLKPTLNEISLCRSCSVTDSYICCVASFRKPFIYCQFHKKISPRMTSWLNEHVRHNCAMRFFNWQSRNPELIAKCECECHRSNLQPWLPYITVCSVRVIPMKHFENFKTWTLWGRAIERQNPVTSFLEQWHTVRPHAFQATLLREIVASTKDMQPFQHFHESNTSDRCGEPSKKTNIGMRSLVEEVCRG